ncbi:hypothetical protein P872_21855 [Rhodonellum psychrophilum GCM71 = DSM 17998]|uniref:N-acetyltransferase ESCO zinc-finger domain-containing protein n=2 Tax=Rhodonellum TaxID=336827 RepID=U5BWY9_9BACT|nr:MULTISPECIES: hypothetical protein [Rhodonellum]ERM80427.1 hypothetical protein P872_21855 [Rhodonellum psychrophilum GCM71 = DSM 17998]SDZ24728.1 hypothetical protein SAMN05444412_108101 [Rhodonellum ikkaensis]
MDSPFDDYRFHFDELLKIFEISLEYVSYRPKVIASGVSSFEAIRPENFVLLLNMLERMGLQINTQRFVEILLPTFVARSKTIFSSAELEFFWYTKYRYKTDDIILFSDKPLLSTEPIDAFKISNGFILSLYKNDENQETLMLRIRAPKYRKRPQIRRVVCDDCGFECQKGDPESSFLHRKEHKRRLSWLKPDPLPIMLLELQKDRIEAEHVSFISSCWKHKEMYNRALAFKREFHNNFVQWSHNGKEDIDAHGFLFTGDKGEIVGACAFRNRTKDGQHQRWGLLWIWFCPNERRNGHLAKRWRMLRLRF